MGVKLDEYKRTNSDKIKIGSCIELLFLLDNFNSDFQKLQNFISNNSEFLNHQSDSVLSKHFYDIMEVLTNSINLVLSDIDKDDVYYEYMSRFY